MLASMDKPAEQEQTAHDRPPKVGTKGTPRHNETKATRVYVVARADGKGCKVGVSSHPKRRLSSLQVSTPEKLTLFHQLRPTAMRAYEIERAALRFLRPFRHRGEWLSCEPKLAKIVVDGTSAGDDRMENFVHAMWVEEQALDRAYKSDLITPEIDRMRLSRKDLKEILAAKTKAAWQAFRVAENTVRAFPDLYAQLGRWNFRSRLYPQPDD
jgi:hypothetical protein